MINSFAFCLFFICLTKLQAQTAIDIDGNVYKTVIIGSQTWFAENLKTTKYSDSTSIPYISERTLWSSNSFPAFCWYKNDSSTNKDSYGGLYNWYSINTGKICPIGWRVPRNSDWEILIANLGSSYLAGDHLKEAGTKHWGNRNSDADNKSGFTALPGGFRGPNGKFYGLYEYGSWWSSSLDDERIKANYRGIRGYDSKVMSYYANKKGGFSVRCLCDSGSFLPQANTKKSISQAEGNLMSNDKNEFNEILKLAGSRGICWDISKNPTIADCIFRDGSAEDSYANSIKSLKPGTKYYVRAYTTDGMEIVYGNELILIKGKETGFKQDINGNCYPTIQIGSQIWMAENLKTTNYKNGDIIETTKPSNSDISSENISKFQWAYKDNESVASKYGRLYTWYTITDNRKLCPGGWHIPSYEDWNVLTDYLGGENVAGGKLKTINKWFRPNIEATNEIGFNGLPAGMRLNKGGFKDIGHLSYFWTSTNANENDAWLRSISNLDSKVSANFKNKQSGLSVRCIRDSVISIDIPYLTTSSIVGSNSTNAISGGIITTDNFSEVAYCGVCWSTSPNPAVKDNHTTDELFQGMFTSSLKGLKKGTKYFVRAYATTKAGTVYGNEISFATIGESGSIKDIDENTYRTINIGTQTWMAENLNATRYQTGDLIGTSSSSGINIESEVTPEYQWPYKGDESNAAIYGRLYTWYVITDIRNVCPTGWHVPNNGDWAILIDFIGGKDLAGIKLKSIIGWNAPNIEGTDEVGFDGLPGGSRLSKGSFKDNGYYSYWWSSSAIDESHAWHNILYYNHSKFKWAIGSKKEGFSVRCIKD